MALRPIWWVFLCDKTPPNWSTDPGRLPYKSLSALLLLGSLRMSFSILFILSLIHLKSLNQIPLRSHQSSYITTNPPREPQLEWLRRLNEISYQPHVMPCLIAPHLDLTFCHKSPCRPQSRSPKGWNSLMFLEQDLTTGPQSNLGLDDKKTESVCHSWGRNSGDMSY